MITQKCDLAIIGGGPAGMAGAIVARRYEMDVCLLDEQPRFGGQIYRQPPRDFRVPSWLSGAGYAKGKALLAQAEQLTGLCHLAPATVWACFKSGSEATADVAHDVLFHNDETAGRVNARHVLIACGCYEAPMPFPGWHLPGVMSAGGIQTLLKSQRIAAGHSVVLAGSHPLLFVVAEQLLSAGVKIAAICMVQSLHAAWGLVRSARTTITGSKQIFSTLKTLIALHQARVPVLYGHVVDEARGSRELGAVRIRDVARGTHRVIDCDALGVCYGFYPSSELARQAGAKHFWAAEGGWVIKADEYMRSSVPGISVAGELTGVAGAEAAALSGEIAALGVARDLGRVSMEQADGQLRKLQKRLTGLRAFASLLARLATPSGELPEQLAHRSTLICRCEDVTLGEIEDAVSSDPGIQSASTAKLLTRAGMGLCQGRMCETSVRRIVARQRGIDLQQVAGYVVRPPVKPVPVALLSAYPGALTLDPHSLADPSQNSRISAPRTTR